MCTEEDKIIK